MFIPINPYIDGNPVGDKDVFVGRDEILQETLNVLENPDTNAIILSGQRRMGKTSVLQKLEIKLQAKNNFYPIFFDFQAKAQWSLEQVLQELALKISETLKQPTPNLDKETKTIFSNWLSNLLNNLSSNSSVVLLFDEFDVLADRESKTKKEFFIYFKELLSNHKKNLNAVFLIGRTVNDLSHIVQVLFTKNIHIVNIDLLDYDNTSKVICLSEINQTLNWSNEAIETVWQLTNGHPFFTQRLCSYVWESIYKDDPDESPTVISTDIEAAIPDILSASSDHLEWLWSNLSQSDQLVISALAQFDQEQITESELEYFLIENEIRTVIRDLKNAQFLLKDWGLIQKINHNYCFPVELIRRWIADYKPFNQILTENKNSMNVISNYVSNTDDTIIKNSKFTFNLLQSKKEDVFLKLIRIFRPKNSLKFKKPK